MRYCPKCELPIADGAPCPHCATSSTRSEIGGGAKHSSPTISLGERAAESARFSQVLDEEGSNTLWFWLKGGLSVAGGAALGIAILLLLLSAFTALGVFLGSIPVICAAGLTWIVVLLEVFIAASRGHLIGEWLRKKSRSIAEHLGSKTIAVYTFLDAIAILLKVIAWLNSLLSRGFYKCMGWTATLAILLTALHIALARRQIQHSPGIHHGFLWLVGTCQAVLPPILGWRADKSKNTHPIPTRTAVEFFTTFEFARCVLLLLCGMWGADAFQAANTILKIPSDDTIFGFHIGLPVKPLSTERTNAAFSLFQVQGPYVYSFLFAFLPLAALVLTLSRGLRKRPGESTTLHADRKAAAIISAALLLLPVSVAIRTGALARYSVALVAHFSGESIDKAFSSCLLHSGSELSDRQCTLQWYGSWYRQLPQSGTNGSVQETVPVSGNIIDAGLSVRKRVQELRSASASK